MGEIGSGLTVLSLVVWLWLLCFRGQFWRSDQQLPDQCGKIEQSQPVYPSVCAVIPARNESDLLPVTLRSLLTQDYPGQFTVILVDDDSSDGTGAIAQATAEKLNQSQQLILLSATPLPSGWTGKLWAIEQGIRQAQTLKPDYFLLTDADVEHDRANLSQLVAKAQSGDLSLVSLMVLLRCESFWEQLLIPAFVFFFEKLYPFRWVNNPACATAAAAGGCILVRREALEQIGGIQTVCQALIDDCALAKAIKRPGGKIWLGLSNQTRSLRPYPSLNTIWEMVARTAFTQLNYSPLLLVGTVVGMTVIYLVSPIATIAGLSLQNWTVAIAGLSGWLMMTLAYFPTVRFYNCSVGLAFCLPAIALLYTLMTLDSAIRHYRGQGGAWKGRTYTRIAKNL